jgi:tetratricopeptide (TPR) repeat protein
VRFLLLVTSDFYCRFFSSLAYSIQRDVPEKKRGETMSCRYCGAQNDGDAIYCGQCGFQLKDDETVVHSPYDTLDTSAPTMPDTIPGSSKPRLNKITNLHEGLVRSLSFDDEKLRLNPYNADARFDRVQTLFQLGRYEEALSSFDDVAGRLDAVDLRFREEILEKMRNQS